MKEQPIVIDSHKMFTIDSEGVLVVALIANGLAEWKEVEEPWSDYNQDIVSRLLAALDS